LPPAAVRPPRIALIIDDIGFNLKRTERFFEADIPMTFSILPHLCRSTASARAIHAHGHEIMLHQPMEPFSPSVDPGPGAIYVEDRPERIHNVVAENLHVLPHVAGVNNHMGSKYTQYLKKMGPVLDVVKKNGLFFVDSLTTGHSTAFSCARDMGVSVKRRDLFLDHQRTVPSVIRQMNRLRQRARKTGSAIGIGHPWPGTADAIRQFLESPQSRDVEFVYISQLV